MSYNTEMKINPKEAPEGYYAVLKSEARPADGSNICNACDWRMECQNPATDFQNPNHRCMGHAVVTAEGRSIKRSDACNVVFKRIYVGCE